MCRFPRNFGFFEEHPPGPARARGLLLGFLVVEGDDLVGFTIDVGNGPGLVGDGVHGEGDAGAGPGGVDGEAAVMVHGPSGAVAHEHQGVADDEEHHRLFREGVGAGILPVSGVGRDRHLAVALFPQRVPLPGNRGGQAADRVFKAVQRRRGGFAVHAAVHGGNCRVDLRVVPVEFTAQDLVVCLPLAQPVVGCVIACHKDSSLYCWAFGASIKAKKRPGVGRFHTFIGTEGALRPFLHLTFRVHTAIMRME